MQVKLDDLDTHLGKGLRAVYTVHGDETLLANEALDTVRRTARQQGFDERQVFTVAGAHFDWSGVLGESAALSLFASRRIVEIRIPSGKPGKEGSEALQQLATQAGPDLLVLVSLPRLDRTQQTSAWFAALDGAGVNLRADPIERRALPAWLAGRARRLGLRLADGPAGQEALTVLADRVEGNLLAAQQELEKLALLFPDTPLTAEGIESAVTDVARFEAGQLSEALWAGDVGRCLHLLDALEAEGEAVVRLHWLLADDIRALRRLKRALAAGQPQPLAMREARVWGPKEKWFERALPRLSLVQLDQLLIAAHQVEGICKGLREPGWPLDPWAALRQWTLMGCEALTHQRLRA
ncbi:DNA polymerase III subunit delta [Inhella gelatinilytica]|uniref:DNA polymerase III subunit delta n=1 Tax=Inhella gelatinilytica TaxID=2795030 RepID=A0A931NDS2_9BURK|nr:DNA polymerase III subunit delta [Inhella gelatinilytica]MBH9551736.1 DNA polymerase III subunit delta [Inhella gelatinilytica]